jgi:hypothetical protein
LLSLWYSFPISTCGIISGGLWWVNIVSMVICGGLR